ncbi:hypothetical protein PVK06_034984 [Gossypium arboreum]|uniref:Uncharacterized protein n=1 Tax=Gossypium arboreum TaxID=29729 RepID=A0ABR0NFN3_GOSAR|nr:hypothetical protein PVK06_034984 [Gossypium arboreum]
MALQLGLPVDGRVITRPVIILVKKDLCNALLRKVLNKFQGSRIEIKWLEENFSKLDEHVIVLEKE